MKSRWLKYFAIFSVVVVVLALLWLGFRWKGDEFARGLIPEEQRGLAEAASGQGDDQRAGKQRRELAGSTISKLTLRGDESGIIHLPPATMREICRRIEASGSGVLQHTGGAQIIGGAYSIPIFMSLFGDLEAGSAWISDGDELHSSRSGLATKVLILGEDGEMVDVDIKATDQGHKLFSSSMTLSRGSGMIWWTGDPDDDGVLLVLGSNSESKAGPGEPQAAPSR